MNNRQLRRSDFLLRLLRPIGFIWMNYEMNSKVTSEVDLKRKDPFLLLGNHVYHYDVVLLALNFRKQPAIVTSEILLSTPRLKWLLQNISKTIPKSKGSADIRTLKQILRYKKLGYPIMVMPEGDATFFGETGYIEESTAKLVKKLDIDVIVGKFKGGFLSSPRWAIGRRANREVSLHYKTIIKKEDIKNLSVDEIYDILKKELYHNDYTWQREQMNSLPGDKLAEGLENIMYVCPVCNSIHSIETKGNFIYCNKCRTAGKYNEYGFIEGFPFDNLVSWNKYQRKFDKELRKMTFQSSAELIRVNNTEFTRSKPEKVELAYHDDTLHIKGKSVMEFPKEELIAPILTERNQLSFKHDGNEYMILVDKYPMSFLRAIQDKY